MRERLIGSAKAGLSAGAKTGWWLIKVMVPITFVVSLLKWAGVIDVISDAVAPFFSWMGLSGDGVAIFITNALSPLYSGIALMATLDIDYRSATILAVMGLICHNMIMETVIQRKAGANAVFIVVLRVGVALIAGFGLNMVLSSDYGGNLIIETQVAVDGFVGIMEQWGLGMMKMIPIMFFMVVGLNILQAVLREFRLIDLLTIPVRPVVRFFGLGRQSSFLWVVLNSLGLAYGGSVLIAELDSGQMPRTEARLLNTHVAITHSLLEDTLIFVAVGLPLFWLIVPRMILSFVAVWTERLYNRIKGL